MILRSKKQTSQEADAVLKNLISGVGNEQQVKTERKEADVQIIDEGQVKNEEEPCLKDLPKHNVSADNYDSNYENFEILFFDYQYPQGIKLDQFAETELQDVVRLHVYAPMITDANLNLVQRCHNNFTGYEICHMLRHGSKKSRNKGMYVSTAEKINYLGKMRPLLPAVLFDDHPSSGIVRRIKWEQNE